MENVLLLSLKIVGIYCIFQQGNILGEIKIGGANLFDKTFGKKWSVIIQKPLWGCLPCMSGLWSIVLTGDVSLELILSVCGILYIIDKLLPDELPKFPKQ